MQKDHLREIDTSAPVTEQASAWWMLLNHGDPTPADHCAFREWVARSPERVEAFLQTARLTRALQSKHVQWPDTPIDTLIREARSAATAVVDLPAARQRSAPQEAHSSHWRRRDFSKIIRSRAAIAAALALVVGVAMIWHFSGTQRFQTAFGEQRSVVLSDGSVVTLNTSSAIEVHMAKNRRTVDLLSGEALFEVEHDPARPFDVTAGNTTVHDVGTQFNVDRRPGSTVVTVVEGKVAVFTGGERAKGDTTGLPLAAGEQLTVGPSTAPHVVRVNLATVIAWTQRRLVFDHRPLGEVAEEFNRYNLERIEIDSPELRSEEITGVFEANDPESFMSFLSKLPGVTITRAAGGRRLIVTHTSAGAGNP
jgi:transmembrane sensor